MLGSVLGFIYAAAQIYMPCLPPIPLSHEVLTTDQYLGKWYYFGAASWDQEDIDMFKYLDNAVLELKKGINDTVQKTLALRVGDECKSMGWTYKTELLLDPIQQHEENYTITWDGKWINCSSCLILAKFHPEDAHVRIMLAGRTKKAPAEVMETFKEKMRCFWIDQFVIAPQTKDHCELGETG